MEIRDSQILITGASSGLGRAVAQVCAETKAHLHLVVRKEDPKLADEMIKAGALSVSVYNVDLSDRKQIEHFLKEIHKTEIDILFNNADQVSDGLLEDQDVDDVYTMMQVNVNAAIHLTQCLLPGMLKRRKGKIINHSSVSAVMNLPGSSTYAASKAAILAFANALRAELKGTPVSTLVLLSPGMDTRMFQGIPSFYGSKLDLGFLKAIPPHQYAQMIKEAILEDLSELKPSGFTWAGMLMAQHLPKVFETLIVQRFKRS